MKVLDFADGVNLNGVHPQLVAMTYRAAVLYHVATGRQRWLRVTSGVRSHARQAELVRLGASQTQNSYHIYGKAVDLAIMETVGNTNRASWDFELYRDLNEQFSIAADEMSGHYTWGGIWQMRDGVHFQLETLGG